MATWAALSAAVLVIVISMQIWHAVQGTGRSVDAANTAAAPLSQQAHTPFDSIDWQSPPPVSTDPPAEASAQAGAAGTPSSAASDPDGISNIGDNVVSTLFDSYASMQQSGTYTPAGGAKVAQGIASTLRANVSYKNYAPSDIATDSDSSTRRIDEYRSDMRTALAPLLKNPGYELKIFASYIESRDGKYLTQLHEAARNYASAVSNAAALRVPQDVVSYHVALLNSLSEFGAIVDSMAAHADDPYASAALLRTYDTAESGMGSSYNALAAYFTSKKI